jgi:hypothetical protein
MLTPQFPHIPRGELTSHLKYYYTIMTGGSQPYKAFACLEQTTAVVVRRLTVEWEDLRKEREDLGREREEVDALNLKLNRKNSGSFDFDDPDPAVQEPGPEAQAQREVESVKVPPTLDSAPGGLFAEARWLWARIREM